MELFAKRYLNIAIAAIIGLSTYFFLPAANGLTEIGVATVAITAFTAYLWVTGYTTWSSFLALALYAIAGTAAPLTVFGWGFGNLVTVFCIVIAIINIALQRSGFIERFITWFITRKAVVGRPWVFIGLYLTAIFVASCFIDVITITVISLAIVKGICSELGYKPGDKFTTMICLASIWVIMWGYLATPIGHTVAIVAISIYESTTGNVLSYLDFMLIGIPVGTIMTIFTFFFMRFVIKPDMSNYVNFDVEARKAKVTKMGKREALTVTWFVIACLSIILPDIIVLFAPDLGAWLKSLTIITPVLVVIAIMSVTYVDGKPLVEISDTMHEVPWTMITLLIGMMGMSSALVAETTGITQWLNYNMVNLTSGITTWVPLVILFATASAVLTNLISCNAVVNLMMVIAMPIAIAMSGTLNPLSLTCVIAVAANAGVMTPAASGASAIYLGSGYISTKDAFKYGLTSIPLVVILSIVFIYPLASLL